MILYHGTDSDSKNKIQGPPLKIDVKLGGGELGRGFYLGGNLHMSVAWAKVKARQTKKSHSVLEFDIDLRSYAKLKDRTLSASEVRALWLYVKRSKKKRLHLVGFDVIVGNLARYPFAAQYKFETTDAEAVLNSAAVSIKL